VILWLTHACNMFVQFTVRIQPRTSRRKTCESSKVLAVLAVLLCVATFAAGRRTSAVDAPRATFPYPIYSKWFDLYHTSHPTVQINYQSIGSGGGIRQLIDKTVISGHPMPDELTIN